MEFSGFQSSVLVESKLELLLSDASPTLESLFSQPDFLSKLHIGQPKLINFLSQQHVVTKILVYLSKLGNPRKQSHAECYEYPFYAFSVLSNCHPSITKTLLENKANLDALFNITMIEGGEYVTCHGYAQGIYKNLLSDGNSLIEEFVRIMNENYKEYLFPYTRNLHRANAEMIAATLASFNFKLRKIQEKLFEDLIDLNFDVIGVSKNYEEIADNLKKILEAITAEGFVYKARLTAQLLSFKIKEPQNPHHLLCVLKAKVAFLIYNLRSDQLTSQIPVNNLLSCYRAVANQPGAKNCLILLLELLKLASQQEKFINCFDHSVIKTLLEVIKETNFSDIIHSSIFKTLNNLKDLISANKDNRRLIIDFILSNTHAARLPHKAAKHPNKISLHFIAQLIQLIDPVFEEISLEKLKKDLCPEFGKLCFNAEDSNFDELSDVKIVLKDSSGGLKLLRSGFEDRRFNDEEEIAPVELLSDIEKFSAGSLVIQKDLFDSLVVEAVKPSTILSDIQIEEEQSAKGVSNLILPLKQGEKRKVYRPKSPYIQKESNDESDKELKKRLFSPEGHNINRKPRLLDSYDEIKGRTNGFS